VDDYYHKIAAFSFPQAAPGTFEKFEKQTCFSFLFLGSH
jgi:hypothetical protein